MTRSNSFWYGKRQTSATSKRRFRWAGRREVARCKSNHVPGRIDTHYHAMGHTCGDLSRNLSVSAANVENSLGAF